MMITDAALTLRQAAEYLGEHGWVQGELSNGKGSACAIGAINRVAGHGSIRSYDAVDALSKYLELPSQRGFLHPVARWNDAAERSAEDVILAMKRAAERFDEQ